MQNQVDTRVVVAVVAALLLIIGFFAWRKIASPSGGGDVSPQQAGLGRPMLPAGAAGKSEPPKSVQ